MEQAPLHHRCVSDKFISFPDQGVHSAERVVPVVVRHVIEGGVEQGAGCIEFHTAEMSRVGDLKAVHTGGSLIQRCVLRS